LRPRAQTTDPKKMLSYQYRHSYNADYSLTVIFFDESSQMRVGVVCEDRGSASVLGFSTFSRESDIVSKLGNPGNVSIRADGLRKAISYPKWHAAFELERGQVVGVCTTSSGKVTYRTPYKEPTATAAAPDPWKVVGVEDDDDLPYPAPPCKSGAKVCEPWERDWKPGAVLPAGAVVDKDGTVWPKGKSAGASASTKQA